MAAASAVSLTIRATMLALIGPPRSLTNTNGPSMISHRFRRPATSSRSSPHLDPIERLWDLMHKHATHNRCHATFADFKVAILTFLREEVPRKRDTYCDQVTDNFRIISPRILGF
jgi:hypothetical protein